MSNPLLERLRYHVTGAIERGEAEAIVERKAQGDSMKLSPVGSNQTEIERADGTTILYSYQTPVAAFVPGKGALCTSERYSNTTSRHINAAVSRWGATRHNVEQSEIDRLAS